MLEDALACALYLEVIVLLAQLPWAGGVAISLLHPAILWLASGESVDPMDSDTDRIMGDGYAEWHRQEAERRRRAKR